MTLRLCLAILLGLTGVIPAVAGCGPWIARNETLFVNNQYLTNPQTASVGLLGEASLPYSVPTGKKLVIDHLAIEAIWGAAMWPWVGAGTFGVNTTSAQVLDTFTSRVPATATGESVGTYQWTPHYELPAGLIFNLTMRNFNAPSEGWVYGWEVSGELCDVP